MILAPYKVDVPLARGPVVNCAIILVTTVVFIAAVRGTISDETIHAMILTDLDPVGLIGSLLLHADLMHLIGNMLFLWVFGNAVNGKVGNAIYPAAYLFCGVAAGLAHLASATGPAVGASGAINGIVGMYVVFFPANRISCFYWVYWVSGTFRIDSRVMIALWFLMDVAGALSGGEGIAYIAHIGGFFAGFCLGSALVYFKLTADTPGAPSLFDLLDGATVDPTPTHPPIRSAPPSLFAPVAQSTHTAAAIPSGAVAAPRVVVRSSPGVTVNAVTVPPPPASAAMPELTLDPASLAASAMPELSLGPGYDPPPPESRYLRCTCGHPMRANPAHAGRKARCKACGRVFVIPPFPAG